jgi:hypothetical protein
MTRLKGIRNLKNPEKELETKDDLNSMCPRNILFHRK